MEDMMPNKKELELANQQLAKRVATLEAERDKLNTRHNSDMELLDEARERLHKKSLELGEVKIKFNKWCKAMKKQYKELMRVHLAVIKFLK